MKVPLKICFFVFICAVTLLHVNTLKKFAFVDSRPIVDHAPAPRVKIVFPFNNEIDLFVLRYRELHDVVDAFVASESLFTQRGFPKKLYLQNFLQYTTEFPKASVHSITTNPFNDTVGDALGWRNEHFVKWSAVRAACSDEPESTIIISSDADEIVSREVIQIVKHMDWKHDVVYTMAHAMSLHLYGFFWVKPGAMYSTAEAGTCARYLRPKGDPYRVEKLSVHNAGWHCTYCMPEVEFYVKLHSANTVDGQLLLSACPWTIDDFVYFKENGIPHNGVERFTSLNTLECMHEGCVPSSLSTMKNVDYMMRNTRMNLPTRVHPWMDEKKQNERCRM